jgi:hypothetical protein
LSNALRPHQIALRLDDFLIRTHGPDFWSLTDELADRHPPSVGKPNTRLARNALPQIRHHRLLLDPLFDAAVQLRERDDRHF